MKSIFLALLLLVSASVFSQSVYKTPSGKKYHLETCRMVKNVSQKITVADAVALGLEPCKICNPQNSYAKTPQQDKAKGTGKTVQCAGFTKAGNRCKHMTAIANGFCYQHQPSSK